MTQLTCSMSFWVGVGNWLEEEKSGWASCLGPSWEDSACQDSAIQGPPSLVMTLAQESSEKPSANTQEVGWKRRAHTLEPMDPRELRPATRYELRLDRCARLIRSLRSRPTRTGNRSPDQLTREWLWAAARSFC